ncbi:MAG: ABC transporter ATP-binding protein [Holophagales bacterium]|jgi:ABC-2 type transport system ATP-binding protein|nr:ABC transporter ATP-binding protein [Holophagales bacterium]
MIVLESHNLSKQYQGVFVISDFSLSLHSGEITCIIGNNGSGKSTILGMLSAIIKPTTGSISVLNQELNLNNGHLKRHLGVMPESLALVDVLTIKENLLLVANAYGIDKQDSLFRSEYLLNYFDLLKYQEYFPYQLSFGTKKKVALCLALLHSPKILILDEPFEGVDVISSNRIQSLLKLLSKKGIAIIIACHQFNLLEKIIDRCVILSSGKVLIDEYYHNIISSNTNLESFYFKFNPPLEMRDIEWIDL